MAGETPATPSSTFPSSSSSSPVDVPTSFDLSDPVGWVLSTQCLVSLLLNAVVLTTYCKDARLRANGSTALLLNLVAADLGITLCGCPFSAVANFSGHWPFGEIGCTLYGFQVGGGDRRKKQQWKRRKRNKSRRKRRSRG